MAKDVFNDRNLEMAEELRKSSQSILDIVNKIQSAQQNIASNLLQRQLDLEKQITKNYEDRLKLMEKLQQGQLSFMQRLAVNGQLGINSMTMANNTGQYLSSLGIGQGAFAGTIAGDVLMGQAIGAGMGGGSNLFARFQKNTMNRILNSSDYTDKQKHRIFESFQNMSDYDKARYNAQLDSGNADADAISKEIGNKVFRPAFAPGFKGYFGGMFKYAGSIFKRAIGPLAAAESIYKAFDYGNEMALGAGRTGFGVEEYQRLQYAAQRSQMGNIEDIFNSYKGARNAALAGDVNARRSFGMIGMGDGDLKDINQGFQQLLNTLSQAKDAPKAMAAAVGIFGDKANQVVNGLQQGFGQFKDMATVLPKATIDTLRSLSDTFVIVVKRVTIGIAGLIEGLHALGNLPIIKQLGQVGKYLVDRIGYTGAALGAYAGGTRGLIAIDQVARQTVESMNNEFSSAGHITNQQKTDVTGAAGFLVNPNFNPWAGGYSQLTDRMQHLGLYLGGAASGVQIQDSTQKDIKTNTKNAVEVLKIISSKI